MSDDDGGRRARVRRVDDRLGLAVLRASLSPRTLVTYARDHVTVRTPSRPQLGDGNTIDLEAPPAPADLAGWVARFHDTVGQLGVRRVQLRWEEPAGPARSGGIAGDLGGEPPASGPALRAAAGDLGLGLEATSVLLLDRLAAAPESPAEVSAVPPPSAVPGGAVDRRWHAATVLYRYAAESPGPDGWRDWDEDAVAWSVEVQRELATDGRARVWLAARHGAPVGRVTLAHDRQALAVVEDLVVHPVHRRAGVGGELVHRAVAEHLAGEPEARVGAGAAPGSVAERVLDRLGFRRHALVWRARSTR